MGSIKNPICDPALVKLFFTQRSGEKKAGTEDGNSRPN